MVESPDAGTKLRSKRGLIGRNPDCDSRTDFVSFSRHRLRFNVGRNEVETSGFLRCGRGLRPLLGFLGGAGTLRAV